MTLCCSQFITIVILLNADLFILQCQTENSGMTEELLGLPLLGALTVGSDIFEEQRKYLKGMAASNIKLVDLNETDRICTDGTSSVTGKNDSFALLEMF